MIYVSTSKTMHLRSLGQLGVFVQVLLVTDKEIGRLSMNKNMGNPMFSPQMQM